MYMLENQHIKKICLITEIVKRKVYAQYQPFYPSMHMLQNLNRKKMFKKFYLAFILSQHAVLPEWSWNASKRLLAQKYELSAYFVE